MSMQPEFKKVWVEALRSGEFKQGRGRLIRDTGYCCLGVACVVWAKQSLVKLEFDGRDVIDPESGERRFGDLPTIAKEASGITNSECDLLARKNDAGVPFPVIADYIEANL